MKIKPVRSKHIPKYPDQYEVEFNNALLKNKPTRWKGVSAAGIALTAVAAAALPGCEAPEARPNGSSSVTSSNISPKYISGELTSQNVTDNKYVVMGDMVIMTSESHNCSPSCETPSNEPSVTTPIKPSLTSTVAVVSEPYNTPTPTKTRAVTMGTHAPSPVTSYNPLETPTLGVPVRSPIVEEDIEPDIKTIETEEPLDGEE